MSASELTQLQRLSLYSKRGIDAVSVTQLTMPNFYCLKLTLCQTVAQKGASRPLCADELTIEQTIGFLACSSWTATLLARYSTLIY